MQRRADLTFRHNVDRGRHGWLRLTPAYSVRVVHDILDGEPGAARVLDPFCGSGTTGLVAAERGLSCDLLEINPFLVWLARAKTFAYSPAQLAQAARALPAVAAAAAGLPADALWQPAIAHIDRWWPPARVEVLSRLHGAIRESVDRGALADPHVADLLRVAFCRCVIAWSNAAFDHPSMSFKRPATRSEEAPAAGYAAFVAWGEQVIASAARPTPRGEVAVAHADARSVPPPRGGPYDVVITSPPYPNRMSYVRELRPYMYWLGFLRDAREAGELDWQAIGGTWGVATSRVAKWAPGAAGVPHAGFDDVVAAIASTPAANAPLLANYVHRYFADATAHVRSLYPHVRPGGRVHYVVGNSKFYGTLVPVEQIYASLLADAGFADVRVEVLRKRNSKHELFEYAVSATRPAAEGR